MYRSQTKEQLQEHKYPNLIAEIIESGYSICTCADHMGLGRYRQEDDQKVLGKLYGQEELLVSEASGLAGLFGVEFEYLFAHDLKLMNGETFAHILWYEYNLQREREIQEIHKRDKIMMELRDKPYLLDFILEVVKWSEDEFNIFVSILQARKTA